MSKGYDLLIEKINEFTKKFYLNKLLRGSIYATASILALYLLLFLLVYYTSPSINVKTILFFSFVLLALFAITYWIILPALAYFKLSKNLTLTQAAALIGNHFFNVKDRLLNTLQLKALADASPHNNQLILAGIDQKIMELKPIPFTKAINLNQNKKHLKYLLIPLTIISLIAIIAPAILKEGSNSFIRYNQEILPKAPFNFIILNQPLQVTQGNNFTLNLKLTGNEFPQEVYLKDGENTYKLTKERISAFSYTFNNIQKNKNIQFFGGGFNSANFTIAVKPRAALLGISAQLIYPPYLQRKNENLNNVGDLQIPEGTKIIWKMQTESSKSIVFILQNKSYNLSVLSNVANFSALLKKTSTYRVVPKNNFSTSTDSLVHQIVVIADQFPSISVTATQDSVSNKRFYFSGKIADDYGFSSLKFKYIIKRANKIIGEQNALIPIKTNQTENAFFYAQNFNNITLNSGDLLTYWFEVADNDGINGTKITKSEIKIYEAPTTQQIAEKLSKGSNLLKEKMEATIKLAANIEKESEKLNQSLLDKKQLSFEDKKQIEELLAKQKQLEEAVKEIKKQNEKNTADKTDNNTLNEELKEKQKEIDNLFNKVLDEKTKELLQKLQKLMEQNNKDQTRDELAKMQLDNKSLKNELDRILELYKQLEFEQNLQNKIDRLNEMAKAQKELSKQTKSEKSALNELKNKQDILQKEFKNLQKELEKLTAKNQELDKPNDFNNPEKESKEIAKKQEESLTELSQNNKQKAAAKQEEAAEKMEQLAQKLNENQQESEEQEDKINAQELRLLLENLLHTSFGQEKIMLTLKKMSNNDPAYIANVQQQSNIKDNMKTIADSLFALSKRVPQIESVVNTEVEKINFNLIKALELLGDRRTAESNRYQQFAMASLNNLALMLNEALAQLQNNQKNGKGKGKGKKQGMQQLQKMQEQLNKNMQKAKDELQKTGNMGTAPKGQMSQEFAKMAQQQQMIREALQKINTEDNKDGKGTLGNLNQTIKEMKQTENDLVNKRIAQETMNRQKNLLTKLLDADKAQREQDEDAKRESKAAKDFPPNYLQMLNKFKKTQQTETELLQKLPPGLNYYYKNKVAEYFKLLNLPAK